MEDKNKQELLPIGRRPGWTRYGVAPAGVVDLAEEGSPASKYEESRAIVQDFDEQLNTVHITISGKDYEYVPYGDDDQLPFKVMQRIGENMVTSQCQLFNVQACYGQGVRFIDRGTREDSQDADIRSFCLRNSLHELFLEQATDMKFFFTSITKVVLCRDHSRIVKVRHKEMCYCRFARLAGKKRFEYVLYGDWRDGAPDPKDIEVLPMLDFYDPLGDLMVRMGREADPMTGEKRKAPKDGTDCEFSIVCRMATPGRQVYSRPYYFSAFRDSWFDIYELIGIGKRFMIKNTSAPRLQIEVHDDYWDVVCDNEGIADADKRKERIKQEKQNIIDFVCGPKNAGKALISGFYVDPSGKEHSMVRVLNLNQGKKEGGDWADDMQEAANTLCFAFGVHPNLIGATPGKSQMNNSGSDKRELFTMKQALEKPFHDVMMKPYHVILHYNGWSEKVTVDVPMLMLTTLDENKDAEKVTNNNEGNGNNQE
ncbi:MAG: hypothetical protein IKH86_03125 [Prevotella sp.]|nr:hypothetical protein [Prevotella sp.]